MAKRLLIELGHGIDQHGQDPTKAAQRAVKDAISRSYICGLREIFDMKNLNDMIVEVEVAVPNPDKVDGEQVLSVIPFGQKSIEVVEGGMSFPGMVIPELGDRTSDILVANAAVVVKIAE